MRMTLRVIRMASAADAARIAGIYSPYVIGSPVSFELEAPDAREMERRITTNLETHPWLVCEVGGVVAGYVYASTHMARAAYCWSVNVSVYTDSNYRRIGLGTALYQSLFACLRLQGVVNAYAGVTLPNGASVGLHESLGFEPVGIYRNIGFKDGKWHDVGWWQLSLQGHDTAPCPLQRLPQAQRLSGWDAAVRSGEKFFKV